MSKSEIKILVELDENRVPAQIHWDADEGDGLQSTQSISLSIWDDENKNTLRIDLWTKEMPIDEMKKFYIDCVGGLSQSLLNATGDEYMSQELSAVCDRLVEYLQKPGNG